MEPTIGFIGAGNMGTALIEGILRAGYRANQLLVIEPDSEKRERLSARGLHALEAASDALKSIQTLFLCVKPQQMPSIINHIRPWINAETVISIAAGLTTSQLAQWLPGKPAIIRAMPNTGAMVGYGMTGLYSASSLSMAAKQTIEQLLKGTGEILWLEEESAMNALTAISGSGPAYFYYLMEAMIAAAEQLGFDTASAEKLVKQTALGAAQLAASRPETPDILRQQVTSKGGTTEAATQQMDIFDMKAHLIEAIEAACKRSFDLAQQNATAPQQ